MLFCYHFGVAERESINSQTGILNIVISESMDKLEIRGYFLRVF